MTNWRRWVGYIEKIMQDKWMIPVTKAEESIEGMLAQYSFYTLRTRGLVLLAITLVLTIPSLVLLLHSCTVTRVSSAPSFCTSPVVSSTKAADTAHLDEPIDLAEEDQTWANKLPLGGSFSPSRCLPTTRVAVLLPFRDREAHLATFLRKMHPFLQVLFLQLDQSDQLVSPGPGHPVHLGCAQPNWLSTFYARTSLQRRFQLLTFLWRKKIPGVSEAIRHITPSPDCFVLHDIDHIPEKQGLIYRYLSP